MHFVTNINVSVRAHNIIIIILTFDDKFKAISITRQTTEWSNSSSSRLPRRFGPRKRFP